MKHIQSYKIFESQATEHPGFPETEEEIHKICELYDIYNYSINDDLSIDVNGSVHLQLNSLKYIPLNFNHIEYYFNCQYNFLKSLKGAPNTVGGGFSCNNNRLKSLKGCPKEVGSSFDCSNNNIMSVDYLPEGIDYTSEYTNFNFNPIYTLIKTFIYKDNAEQLVQEFNDYDIIRGDTVVLDRLETFINDFDSEMSNLDEVKEYYTIA